MATPPPQHTRLVQHGRHGLQHRTERGASAVEYGLLIVLIAVVIIAAVGVLGVNTQGLFTKACNSMPDYSSGSTC